MTWSSWHFNPRSHEGSDGVQVITTNQAQKISILAPTRGATAVVYRILADCVFQSSLPRRERRPDGEYQIRFPDFNPRSHEGSDTLCTAERVFPLPFQSTLPRGERLSILQPKNCAFNISIHAPTRGATRFFLLQLP